MANGNLVEALQCCPRAKRAAIQEVLSGRQPRLSDPLSESIPGMTTEAMIDKIEPTDRVGELLSGVSPRHRSVLRLVSEGKGVAQIAYEIGGNETDAMHAIYRATQKARSVVRNPWG